MNNSREDKGKIAEKRKRGIFIAIKEDNPKKAFSRFFYAIYKTIATIIELLWLIVLIPFKLIFGLFSGS